MSLGVNGKKRLGFELEDLSLLTPVVKPSNNSDSGFPGGAVVESLPANAGDTV